MTVISLTTRELHDLLNPVLPHAGSDKDIPGLSVVRLEVRDRVLYAVATDRYTMAVTRHRLQDATADTTIAIGKADAAALLKLFKHGRTEDPDLQLAVGNVEAETVLDPTDRPSLTVTAKDGNTLVVLGRDDKPLTAWSDILSKHIHREQQPADPNLALNPNHLSRWSKAIRGSQPLAVSLGPKLNDPVLIRAGDHFIGIWAAIKWQRELDLADSPWCKEIPPVVDEPAATAPETPAREPEAVRRAS